MSCSILLGKPELKGGVNDPAEALDGGGAGHWAGRLKPGPRVRYLAMSLSAVCSCAKNTGKVVLNHKQRLRLGVFILLSQAKLVIASARVVMQKSFPPPKLHMM